jgi:hypothetical protein
MGVDLHLAPTPTMKSNNNNNNGHRTRKKKYAVSDLPFGHWDADSRKWRTCFIPSLLAWAGAQADPFGTNSQMVDEITALWPRIYPTIVLNDARTSTILGVVRMFPEPSWHEQLLIHIYF